ncbi:hypothetical protein [Clostridium tetani]|uniref:hypothetical protein n=1 Tax=Clostridium tetani TaxID=1513 RepID=UPI000D219A35|nr:hypothetical protein [Clostridium tetani]AVP55971.1 hypothetical protein C3B72_12860 [Clostridium tetani]BDR63102.1 hypothetical protein K134307016_00360 [Clostridium tetani]BDR65808.1 hypothetical protein K144312032_00360 [Clostridium tetani]BDR77102.1 hypothetical protein K154307017_00350 [Clostridium tetani]
MGNAYEMMAVAESCPGYKANYDEIQSSTEEFDNKSCRNCINFENEVCKIDYYDTIVKGFDQC